MFDLMIQKQWEPGVTGPRLAKELGVSLAVIERDASDARKVLRYVGEPALVRELIVGGAVSLFQREPDGRVRLSALELLAKVTGNIETKQSVAITWQGRSDIEVYADVANDPGLRAYLVAHGWTPPALPVLEASGEELPP